MSKKIANQHKGSVKNSWNGLSDEERKDVTIESHAKWWLEQNTDNLSNNTLGIVAGIIGSKLLDEGGIF